MIQRFTLYRLIVEYPLYFLLFGTGLLLWPGLNGGFILDDLVNLPEIERLGGVESWNHFVRFILGGVSGPSGRPLALLTFALNSSHWPTDPWVFKFTNLMLHLFIGLLLYLLTQTLFKNFYAADPFFHNKVRLLALLTTGLWLLHPLNLSTVFYVIQRMNQLSTLFILLGLLFYISGRRMMALSPWAGYMRLSFGMGGMAIMAVLSKENGVLLPAFALLVEYMVLRREKSPTPRYWWLWSALFLYLPLVLSVGYLIFSWESFHARFLVRGFAPWEGLLTQFRVLLDYIGQILLPKMSGMGLFQDDYPISHGFLDPWQTLAAFFILFGMILVAFGARKRWPIWSFGLFWFFIGHLLESSVLPLELYFEHRNYLPMMGLLFIVGHLFLTKPDNKSMVSFLRFAMVSYVALLVFLTWQGAKLWGNAELQAYIWSDENPTSIRAQQFAANYLSLKGSREQAYIRLHQALSHHPDDIGLRLELIQLDCLFNRLQPADLERLYVWLPKGHYDSGVSSDTIHKLSILQEKGLCPLITEEDILRMLKGVIANPAFSNDSKLMGNLYYFLGHLYVKQRDLNSAIESLELATFYMPNDIDIPLLQAVWLSSAGLPEQALMFVTKARKMDQNAGMSRNLRQNDIDQLERMIQKTIQKPLLEP
ncbi:MAG: tetratricopeptide repeat protein [Magnetococcus sp. DMHC-6]